MGQTKAYWVNAGFTLKKKYININIDINVYFG